MQTGSRKKKPSGRQASGKGMAEPEPGAGMPEPGVSTARAAEGMPVPEMPEGAPGGEMPAAAMPEGAEPGDEMPAPDMESSGMMEPAGLSGMPSASMQDEEAREPRFPAQTPPGGVEPRWEPGCVEVEFREGVRPRLAAAATPEAPAIESRAAVDMGPVNRVLSRHHVRRCDPSFDTAPEEADRAQTAALRQGVALPHLGNFFALQFPPTADVEAIARELNELSEVERAVPVPRAIPPLTPENEPLVGTTDDVVLDPATGLENQWYVFRCNVPQAWAYSSGHGVVLADIDWGYRTTHEDLQPRLDMGQAYNSYDGSSVVDHGTFIYHGTGVMGLAGAADNDKGMAGIAFRASLWPIQANAGPGSSLVGNSWARAIEHVRTANSGGARKVIILEVQTNSFGNYEMLPSVNVAIQTAIAGGVVVCVAAGNGDRDAGIDDAGDPIPQTGSILVGATAYDANSNPRAGFSNYGPRVVVAAPGDSSHDITCSSLGNTDYRNGFGGTSGATPKVAATAALMLEVDPGLSHAEIRDILRLTGSTVVTDAAKPVGTFLNADAAVREVVRRKTARLDVFVRGAARAVWERVQTAPNDGWVGWAPLGGWVDLTAAAKNQDGRLEVFARGGDKALWHRWQTAPSGAWSGWASLGGWIDRLAVGENYDGRLEAFVRGTDGAVWHKWQTAPNDGWSGWASLGGWIEQMAVARNQDGRLEVFARGADSALWHKWQTTPGGGWSGWASLGGWVDSLTVGQNQDGRLEVFCRGQNKALWHKWQTAPNDGWSGWASLGGWIDLVSVARNADGRLEVFVRGDDKALWHKWQVAPNNGWSNWDSLGGWIDRLAVGRNADGRLEAFVRGMNRSLWHKWQVAPNNGWSGWTSLGGWIDQITIGERTYP